QVAGARARPSRTVDGNLAAGATALHEAPGRHKAASFEIRSTVACAARKTDRSAAGAFYRAAIDPNARQITRGRRGLLVSGEGQVAAGHIRHGAAVDGDAAVGGHSQAVGAEVGLAVSRKGDPVRGVGQGDGDVRTIDVGAAVVEVDLVAGAESVI